MNLKLWILMLLSYLRPAEDDPAPDAGPVDDSDPDADPADDPDADPADDADPAPNDDADPDPAPQLSRGQKAIVAARERAQQAEAESNRLRGELDATRRQSVQQAPTQDQVLWQQEEAALQNAATTEEVRYAINAQRNARFAQNQVRQIQFQTADIQDQIAFDKVSAQKPDLVKKYAGRVNEELTKMRAQGQNAPREAILAVLVGRDALNGTLKPSKSANAGANRTPQNRPSSDVTARSGKLSPADAARRRLDRSYASR